MVTSLFEPFPVILQLIGAPLKAEIGLSSKDIVLLSSTTSQPIDEGENILCLEVNCQQCVQQKEIIHF